MQQSDARIGDWLQTFTGRAFYPLDPRPEDVDILDIAHASAMRCRYAGHTTRFYSVAEHSVLLSRLVPAEDALWALLHDAAEAYSADIPSPIKRMFPEWKAMEAKIMRAVCLRFDLPTEEPESVRYFDRAILSDERAALMAPCVIPWGNLPPPTGATIMGYRWDAARARFLDRFAALTEGPRPQACACESGKTCQWPNCPNDGGGLGHYP